MNKQRQNKNLLTFQNSIYMTGKEEERPTPESITGILKVTRVIILKI